MIGSKGYKGNSFKDDLSYEIPKVTIADIVEEWLENRKTKMINKEQKNDNSIEK